VIEERYVQSRTKLQSAIQINKIKDSTPPALALVRMPTEEVAVTSAGWSFDLVLSVACFGTTFSENRRSLRWPTLAPDQSESECDACRMHIWTFATS
jgi:hypothetical protein